MRSLYLDIYSIRQRYISWPSRCQHGTRYRYADVWSYSTPQITTGLLQGVSKRIQKEAEETFYSALNHFVLAVGYRRYADPTRFPQTLPIASLSIAFDIRDGILESLDESRVQLRLISGIEFDVLSRS